jgi:hypothetical protein
MFRQIYERGISTEWQQLGGRETTEPTHAFRFPRFVPVPQRDLSERIAPPCIYGAEGSSDQGKPHKNETHVYDGREG